MTAWQSQVSRIYGALKGKAAAEFVVTASGSIAISILAALAGIVAARLLGPSGRGELAAAMVWAGILGTVAHVGIPQALTFFTAKQPDQIGSIFRAALLLCCLQSVGILVVGWVAIEAVLGRSEPDAVRTVQLGLFSIPPAMLITYLATLGQGVRDFRLFSLLRVSSSSSYLLAVGLAYVLGLYFARSVVAIMVIVQVLFAAAALAGFYIRIRPRGNFERSWLTQLVRYGLKSYGGSLSWIANARVDQFVMSVFAGLENLGQYAVAVSYASVLFPVLGAFAMVLFPHVAASPEHLAKRKIKLALTLNFVAASAGALILGSISWFAIPLLFGSDFSPAVVPAVILLVGTIVLSCNFVLSDGLRGLGQPTIPTIAEVCGLIATLAGLYLLLPKLGIRGAAWASVLSYSVTFSVLLFGIWPTLNGKRKLESPSNGENRSRHSESYSERG